MASSGTIGLSINFKYKPERGREEALVGGTVRVKSSAVIEAADLELKTIKLFTLGAYATRDRPGAPAVLYGSIDTSGSLANSVALTTLRSSIVPHTGTQHVGSRGGGTMKLNFIAFGG